MDNMTSTEAYEEAEDEGWSIPVQVILVILFVIIALTNIIGNTCTLIAFFKDDKLQTINNYYICNLAITDLIIGISSVPFYAAYTVMNYYWPFGRGWCKTWSVLDFLVCAESSLTIILISLDRLLMVKLGPGEYPRKVTKRRTVLMIAVSWLLAFLMYGPAIIGFDIWRGYSTVAEGDCDTEFAEDFLYTLITAILEFCIPFILVCTFNGLLYLDIRQRARKVVPAEVTSNAAQHFTKAKTLSKDRKAARNLAMLVVAFLICWTPYTISTIVYAICDEDCVNIDMYEFFNFLLWINSSLNPFLYAFGNRRIAAHYRHMLCRCVPDRNGRVRPVDMPAETKVTHIKVNPALTKVTHQDQHC